MTTRLSIAVFLSSIGTALALWCLAQTTAISMTLFFSVGIPAYGLGAILYIAEVLLDLRRHRVL